MDLQTHRSEAQEASETHLDVVLGVAMIVLLFVLGLMLAIAVSFTSSILIEEH